MRATLEQMIEENGADELMKIIARCEHALDVGTVPFVYLECTGRAAIEPLRTERKWTALSEVVLSGRLICVDEREIAIVRKHLPAHIELTLAEAGCVSFAVHPASDDGVWQVDERFVDAAAFEAHQRRVASSAWGRATADIQRDYIIRGVE